MIELVAYQGSPLPGRLVYRVDQLSFDTEPRPPGAIASLTINEVELMLDEAGTLLFVSGYSPFHGWRRIPLERPHSHDGRLVVVRPRIPTGTGRSIDFGGARWNVEFDPTVGLIRFGQSESPCDVVGVRFAPGATAELRNNQVCALWLQPDNFPFLDLSQRNARA